jgi:N-acetylneuraminate synthase/N,N'-diacetyllegionaminate synthase
MFKKEVRIGEKLIGNQHSCFIVAEAGVSHFGSTDKALELVDVAVKAKADAIKFQIFQTDRLISATASDWIDRMRPKELSIEAFQEIQAYCRQKGIIFFATAHDEESLNELAKLDPPAYKIGSGELQNFGFFRQVASLKRPVIFSTGMFTEKDIRKTINILAEAGCNEVVMLHCVTGYPVPNESVNLLAIRTLKNIFPGPVGYSDHSATYDIAAASVLMGANLIERHLTLEKDIPNAQDWKVSCNPEELQQFVTMTRRLESAMGDGRLQPAEVELENINWARKSIVAAEDILPDDVITIQKLHIKRPGTGISPAKLEKVIGKRARVKIKADTLINWKQLK